MISSTRKRNLVDALSIYERDRKARFHFGPDTGAGLGEVGPARALIEEAVADAIETDHVPTPVHTYVFKAFFEIVRGDAGVAATTRKLPSSPAKRMR